MNFSRPYWLNFDTFNYAAFPPSFGYCLYYIAFGSSAIACAVLWTVWLPVCLISFFRRDGPFAFDEEKRKASALKRGSSAGAWAIGAVLVISAIKMFIWPMLGLGGAS